MRSLIVMIIAVAFIATSCSVKHVIDFDNDFSGQASYEIDYSELMSSMGPMMGMDSTSADGGGSSDDAMSSKEIKKMTNEMEKVKGISNFNVSENAEENRLKMAFDFKDVSALNLALGASKEGKGKESEGRDVITKTSKNLTFDFWGADLDEFIKDESEESEEKSELEEEIEEGMGDMMDMVFMGIQYELVMNFPKPIKGVSNKLYQISEDRKQVTLAVGMKEIIEENNNLKLEVEF